MKSEFKKEVKKTLTLLKEKLIIVDLSDLQSAAEIHSEFEVFVDIWRHSDFELAATFAESLIDSIQALIMDEITADKVETILQEGLARYADFLTGDFTNEESLFKTAAYQPSEQNIHTKAVTSTKFELDDWDLLIEFILEAEEHLALAESELLKLENNCSDLEAINAIFRTFHTIKGASRFLLLHQIGDLAHEAESLLHKARQGELILQGDYFDLVLAAVDEMRQLLDLARQAAQIGVLPLRPQSVTLIKNIKICHEDSSTVDIDAQTALLTQHKTGDVAHIKEVVKVDTERLDMLLELIGELVIAETMVRQAPDLNVPKLSPMLGNLKQLHKITRDLHEMATSLRMMPIKPIFQKMQRLVRDVAHKMSKKVTLTTEGEDIKLDKSMISQLADPLIHMLRNAVDHGIDSPQERNRLGKLECGKIELKAFHKEGGFVIEILDDGRGLNRQ
ncbi:MAG: Hpt domain-containing protein, partial [Lentisphaeraceae bacterium]|nr:Hpt domain-containing protein [Lentisphaeraceae bacterium]